MVNMEAFLDEWTVVGLKVSGPGRQTSPSLASCWASAWQEGQEKSDGHRMAHIEKSVHAV